jgi:hypothetical protein|tara:strand:- start:314 stop:631 length:318 start_codon:yes stop_codon:yes gene_type:complete
MTRADEIMLIATTADNDGMMAPLSRLRSINGGTGSVVLTFDAGANVDTVTLTCGADEFEAVKQVSRALNNACRNTQSNVVVLADSAAASATVTIVPEITGCSTIA